MQSNSKTAAPRKLPNVYCSTANKLRGYIFTEDHISEATKQTARGLIDRLVELAGITRQDFPADVTGCTTRPGRARTGEGKGSGWCKIRACQD
ncbi:MAG: hypothetical protein ACJ74T_08000 [Pyrinomonadaceae bacterium]